MTAVDEATIADLLVARIDQHLADMPASRKLLTLDEHVDVLLDLRNLATTGSTP